jgi:hypothetical protein
MSSKVCNLTDLDNLTLVCFRILKRLQETSFFLLQTSAIWNLFIKLSIHDFSNFTLMPKCSEIGTRSSFYVLLYGTDPWQCFWSISYLVIMSPPHFGGGDILFLSCPSVRHTVCQRNSSETTEQNFMKLGR